MSILYAVIDEGSCAGAMQFVARGLRFSHEQPLEGECMNKDQVMGTVKEAAGMVQQRAGKMVGSSKQEAKGFAKKVEGKVQKKVGDAKEKLTHARDALKGARGKI